VTGLPVRPQLQGRITSIAESCTKTCRSCLEPGIGTVTDATGLNIHDVSGSPEFQEHVRQEIAKLPESDRKLLADKGINYKLASKISDVEPKAECDQTPRGLEPGETCDDLSGRFDGRNSITVPETAKGQKLPPDWQAYAARHETGHGIDHALGDPSHSDGFKDAYKKDAENMSPERRAANGYMLMKGNAGQEEEWADAYAVNRGTKFQHNDFPNSIEYVRDYLAKSGLK
jgi:hypothetical protein